MTNIQEQGCKRKEAVAFKRHDMEWNGMMTWNDHESTTDLSPPDIEVSPLPFGQVCDHGLD